MATIVVRLNGTNENPFAKWGLNQNPFPQIPKAEYSEACLRMQSLGGEPIPNVEHIRKTLEGFTPEFVNLCCRMFKRGMYVTFTVEWPD